MKKLLLKILLFLITLPITYLLVIALLIFTNLNNLFNVRLDKPGTGIGNTTRRMQEVAQITGPVDFLFIGSSHAYRGFDTRIFDEAGYSSFNLGTTAQSPLNTYYLLQDHLPRLQPKYLVVELYWEVLKDNGAEACIDLLSSVPVNKTMVEMTVSTQNVSTFNTLIAAAFSRIWEPQKQVEPILNTTEQYIPGGFVSSTLTHQTSNLNKLKPKEAKLKPEQLVYLEKIIQQARFHGATPLFVVAPVTNEYKTAVKNYSAFMKQLTNYLQQYDIALLDFNEGKYQLHLSSETDFYDYHHLTQPGVRKFNLFLLEALRQEKLLN
ncbi:hypothetical protein ACMA1I_16370 [Pontibacter sp. 13R65]|uniref:hypothetical protein n=1 Tax=Pontibacter sp. 13R65 TaxID=3127458 RepID=UPI00301C6D15